MKFLLLTTLLVSMGVSAQGRGYSESDGSAPETFTSKSTEVIKSKKTTEPTTSGNEVQEQRQAAPTTSETGLINSSGVTTDQMNTSPNTPPVSDADVIRDSTLSTGPKKETRDGMFDPSKPGEIQAQEDENALDYSTTPEKRTTKPLGPNKK